MNRRQFLGATLSTSAALAAGPLPLHAAQMQSAAGPSGSSGLSAMKSIPIGVFNPPFHNLSLDAMLDKFVSLGIEAAEITAAGGAGTPQCPRAELYADPAKARAWKKKFDDRGIRLMALSCHNNALHPDPAKAAAMAEEFRQTIQLAGMLEVPTVVGFSGCPAASPAGTVPQWILFSPSGPGSALEWQWKERAIPYWQQTAKFAREHGVHRIALEMFPNNIAYNPRTLIRLRDAAGEEIGANNDLSHLFWQQCDAVEVIRYFGKHGALYHAHMKDTVFFRENVARFGILNFASKDDPEGSEYFRAVGYGHSANEWKDIVAAYMEIGYDGMLSIENEDPLLTGEVGVERSLAVLKNVRQELLADGPNPGAAASL